MLGGPRSAVLVMVRVTTFTVMAVPLGEEVGFAGFRFSGVARSYGNGGSSNGGDGLYGDDAGVEYGSANPDRGSGEHQVVLVRVGEAVVVLMLQMVVIFWVVKLTIILGGGDSDDGVGIRMGWGL